MDADSFRLLKDRDLRSEGIFVAEGRILVDRLLRSGAPVDSVLCSPRFEEHYRNLVPRFVDLIVRSDKELANIAGYPFHRGVLASGPREEKLTLDC